MTPNTTFRLALTTTILSVLIFCAYVTRTHAPTQMPVPVPMAPSAVTTQNNTLDTDADNKARQAARDFVKENYPNSKSDGVFLLAFRTDNLYLAGVDTATSSSTGTLRQTVDLLVRQYVRKNGNTYWRAENIGHDEAVRLRNLQLLK